MGYGIVIDKSRNEKKLESARRLGNLQTLIFTDLTCGVGYFHKKFVVVPSVSNKYTIGLPVSILSPIIGGQYLMYTDFSSLNNIIRPTIGLQFWFGFIEISYGYNFRLDNNTPIPINNHNIQLVIRSSNISKFD